MNTVHLLLHLWWMKRLSLLRYVVYNLTIVAGMTLILLVSIYSEACLKRPLKIRQNNGLNGSLMKGENIAECSPWSILQYF